VIRHLGPKEIGVSEYFANWLYDPSRMAAARSWIRVVLRSGVGRCGRRAAKGVEAISQKLKVSQHNQVDDDDATILLEYPDATVIN